MIKDLKDLKKLMILCREQGIDAFEIGEIKFNLGTKPQPKVRKTKEKETVLAPGGITEEVQIPTDSISEHDMLFWSVTDNQQ